MRGLEKRFNALPVALTALLTVLLGACDANSPTEPTQTPNAPASSSATTGFAISVGLSPNSVVLGEDTTVQVTVVARRTDTNELVPEDSTALLSATSGTLTNEDATGTGTTVTLTFDFNGTATATLAGVTETAVIRAQIEQSTGQATLTVAEAATVTPLTLVQAVPNFGPPTGGTEVRIEGTGFSLPTEVVFGGISVPVLSVTSSVIRVLSPQIELPSGQNQTVSITVSINVGDDDAASGTLSSGFTYTRNATPLIPKIISVTPTVGPNEGGTRVTIFGEAFGSEVQVFFGASSFIEAPIIDLTSTRILVETPPATGQNAGVRNSTVAVRVNDLRSGFEVSLGSAFHYGLINDTIQITAVGPTEGIYLGGTLVTIFSTGGFEAPVTVEFGGEAQQVVSVSGTEIVARSVPVEIGCTSQSGGTTVVNIETGESGSGPAFTYESVQPEIGSVSTDSTLADVFSGAIILGSPTTVTMGGTGFDRQSRLPLVEFGDVRATSVAITSIDPNPFYDGYGIGDVMSIGIPPAPTPWPEESCIEGGSSGNRYVDVDVELTVTARDTTCSDSITFTYLPSNGACRFGPTADFSFSANGADVTFIDLSTGATSLQWNFDDGVVETGTPGEVRVHTYAASGTYSVDLTASNAEGTNTVTKSVTVVIVVVVEPVAIFTTTISDLVVTVTDGSLNSPTVLEWDFGDGTNTETGAPGESRSHTYAAAGTYDILLTATNSAGSDSTTNTITVTAAPSP